jgi:tetrahydromethanopterin S-methyltransferase subunit A
LRFHHAGINIRFGLVFVTRKEGHVWQHCFGALEESC